MVVLLLNVARVSGWSLWNDNFVQFSASNYRGNDVTGALGKKVGWEETWKAEYKGLNEGEEYPGPWPRPRRGHSIVKMEMKASDCVAGVGAGTCDPGVYIVLFGGRDNDGTKEHIPKTYNVNKNEDGTLNITTYDKKPVDPCFDDPSNPYYTQDEVAARNCEASSSNVPVGFIYNDVWAYKVFPTRTPQEAQASNGTDEANRFECQRTWDSPCIESGWISWHPGALEGGCVIQLGIEVCTVPSERYEHGAVAYNDGAMYVYGGFSQRCADFCDDMWFFDIFLKGWRQVYSAGRLSRFYDVNLDGTYSLIPGVPIDGSTVPNAGPGKRWKHSMAGDGTRMAIFGGHRLWHGFSPENSQDNEWRLAETRPFGGYLNDLWIYTKVLDTETVPGSTFKTSEGSWEKRELAASCAAPDAACVWPGNRAGHSSVIDTRRNLVWIFGGYRTYYPYLKTDGKGSGKGVTALGVGGFVPYPEYDYYLNDLWYYNITNGLWTEVKAVQVQKIQVTAYTPGMNLNPDIKFALVFRYLSSVDATLLSVDVTRCVSITSTAKEIKAALEELPSVQDISVVRSGYGNFKYPYGFTWRVYFQGNAILGDLSAQFGDEHRCNPVKEVMETYVGIGELTSLLDTFYGGCRLAMDENYGGNLKTRVQPGDLIVIQNTTALPAYGPTAVEYVKEVYSVEEKEVFFTKTEWDVCGFTGANNVKLFVKSNILVSVTTEDDIIPPPRSEMVMLMVNEDNLIDKQVVNDTLVIHGGYANNYAFDDMWYFDIQTSRWLEKHTFVYPDYTEGCSDDWDYIQQVEDDPDIPASEKCVKQSYAKDLLRSNTFPFRPKPYFPDEENDPNHLETGQEHYWPDFRYGPYWNIQDKGFEATMDDMREKNNSGEIPMEEHPAYNHRPVWQLYRDDAESAFGSDWSDNMLAQDGTPVVPFSGTGPDQYVRAFLYRINASAVATLYEHCTSVYAEPTRDTVLDGLLGRSDKQVSIAVPRRQRPGWDGCRDNANENGKPGLAYEKPTARFAHAAVYVEETREIFLYGGMAYDQERLPSIVETFPMAVKGDMWQFSFDHCINNCSFHGTCMYGFCICDTGYYGVDCSNTSCPGTSCFYDDLTHEQQCQHGCQSSYNHTDIDVYVQDAVKVPCSQMLPGEENGICDGYGHTMCAPPFIGLDCAVRDCPNDCSYNGWCSVEFPVSRCMCNPGYYGEICEFQECLNNCSFPNGLCNQDTGQCTCRMMYSPYENYKEFHPWGGEDCSYLHAYAAAPSVMRSGFSVVLLLVLLVTVALGYGGVDERWTRTWLEGEDGHSSA